jgi:NAD(P)-dependent dehydrogenase (short-subunit alcohol dehydrogenase family)
VALEGKVALITGGSRGIGRGIAARFLQMGVRVVAASRTESDLSETSGALSELGELDVFRCDVTDPDQVSALVARTVERFGTLDILVCSHGIHEDGVSILDYPLDRWDRVMAINVRGTFLCIQAAARVMVEHNRAGRIINVTSTAALASVEREAAYDTSKGASQSLTRAAALDLAPYGITVNAIAPAWIVTPMLPEALRTAYVDIINPLRRFGEPDDIAGAAVWLADPGTAYVTGATIVIDGGQVAALGFASQARSDSERERGVSA